MDNCKDISYLINNKKVIEFVWGKVPNSPAKHTAIVVKFDGDPEIVMDLSALNPNKSSALRLFQYVQGITQLSLPDYVGPIPSNINVCFFNKEEGFDVLGSMLKFSIVDKVDKKRASCLISDLQLIDMGPYHAKKNNCRAFMRRAFKILGNEPECTEINRENFENEITALENEDTRKVYAAKVFAGIGLLALGAAQLYAANFVETDGPEPVYESLRDAVDENNDEEKICDTDDKNSSGDLFVKKMEKMPHGWENQF